MSQRPILFKLPNRCLAAAFLITTTSFLTAPTAIIRGEETRTVNDSLVVHEWGTFTTFSGSDGVFLDFRPLAQDHNDLPAFVNHRASGSIEAYRGKRLLRGRVRMETPVTYFYTDQIQNVRVSVDFPQGLFTEFYPPVQQMLPAFDPKTAFTTGEPLGNSRLDWGDVTLIPIDHLVPGIPDAQQRDRLAAHIARTAVPQGANGEHYAAARNTDSALVHVDNQYVEKFLFYRGVGNFSLPFKTHFQRQELTFANHSDLPVSGAILVDVQGDRLRMSQMLPLESGHTRAFDSPQEVSAEALAEAVRARLIAEGLFEKEAMAMVDTWQQSWFSEQGTRVLYIVPQTMTEELLPLHIDPQPQHTLRVLVGRMEIMDPTAEQRLFAAVAESVTARAQHLAAEKDREVRTPFPVSPDILRLGRLTEPALARVAALSGDQRVRQEAQYLIAQLQAE